MTTIPETWTPADPPHLSVPVPRLRHCSGCGALTVDGDGHACARPESWSTAR